MKRGYTAFLTVAVAGIGAYFIASSPWKNRTLQTETSKVCDCGPADKTELYVEQGEASLEFMRMLGSSVERMTIVFVGSGDEVQHFVENATSSAFMMVDPRGVRAKEVGVTHYPAVAIVRGDKTVLVGNGRPVSLDDLEAVKEAVAVPSNKPGANPVR